MAYVYQLTINSYYYYYFFINKNTYKHSQGLYDFSVKFYYFFSELG